MSLLKFLNGMPRVVLEASCGTTPECASELATWLERALWTATTTDENAKGTLFRKIETYCAH